jgi:hypothetical protein
VTACFHHPGREATHRASAADATAVCGECATRIASRLEREMARRAPVRVVPGSLFDEETAP